MELIKILTPHFGELHIYNMPRTSRNGHPCECSFYATKDDQKLIKVYSTVIPFNAPEDRKKKLADKYERYDRGFKNEYEVMHDDRSDLFPRYYEYYFKSVQVSDWGPDKISGILWITCIAMENIKGLTLEEYLSNKLPEGRRSGFHVLFDRGQQLRIMEQTYRAVKTLYDKGFFHLDLNPSNMILVDNSSLKLRFIDVTSCKRRGSDKNYYPYSLISENIKDQTSYKKAGRTDVDFTSEDYLADDWINILLVKCFRQFYMRLFYCGSACFNGADKRVFSRGRKRQDPESNPFLNKRMFGDIMRNQFRHDVTAGGWIDRDENYLIRHGIENGPLFQIWYEELREFLEGSA